MLCLKVTISDNSRIWQLRLLANQGRGNVINGQIQRNIIPYKFLDVVIQRLYVTTFTRQQYSSPADFCTVVYLDQNDKATGQEDDTTNSVHVVVLDVVFQQTVHANKTPKVKGRASRDTLKAITIKTRPGGPNIDRSTPETILAASAETSAIGQCLVILILTFQFNAILEIDYLYVANFWMLFYR